MRDAYEEFNPVQGSTTGFVAHHRKNCVELLTVVGTNEIMLDEMSCLERTKRIRIPKRKEPGYFDNRGGKSFFTTFLDDILPIPSSYFLLTNWVFIALE